ncbi:hypothetical protein KJ673_02660 [Patescibacteria group bacterium]|nr:hypothetical protein [Patescibacteria group bacterium]MBU4453078.1 hypothetical protein [Patescibacteria group bacterium]MCG2687265.1 hypothetical protein [Candidatus Parcubacteria bacterium]
MEIRMIQHGLAGRIQGQAAYDAIHRLVALRRSGILRPLTDRIGCWLEVRMLGLPTQARVERGNDVEEAKARCLKAGTEHWVIDNTFPEKPSAYEAQEWLNRGHKVK